MREADYEPEEGEIQDDDEGVDGSQPVPEDTGLGKNKRAHVSSYSHHSSRGDTLHHRLLDPNMHTGERLRAAIMDWVAPSKSNTARSSRFRESTTQSRYPHSRHCIKEWSNMKSLGRNSLREPHTRENHSTSKAWCPTYCSKLHERNSISNYADSGNNGQEPSSTRWSYYSKSVKGLDSKKKPTCDKSTNTMERRQKNLSHSRMYNSGSKQNNSKKDQKSISEEKIQVPESVETNDKETVKESLPVHSPAKSDCSDVVEIINVPRKEPEVITIEDSDEEVDKMSRLDGSESENETNTPLENNDSQSETVDIPHNLHTQPVPCEKINVNNQNIDISQQSSYNETNDSAKSPHMSIVWDPICTVDVTEKEKDASLHPSEDQCNIPDDPILESPCGSDAQDIQCNDLNIITSTLVRSDQILEEVNQSVIPETCKDSLESPTTDLNIAPILDDSVQVDNREIISVNSTTLNSVNDFRSDINETSITKVSFNKNFDIFSKENPLQYVSYWGNSTHGNRDSMQNNKITSLSLGQVLTNRFYSDSPYIRQPQYATVYFDRVGSNNGKCKSYDGQKYRFSVKVPEFIINIGRDSDSGDDSDSKSDTDTKTDDTPSEQLTPNKIIPSPSIPVDFEKKLDVLLKQARYQQEEKTQSDKDNIKASSSMESSLSSEERINPCEKVSNTTSTSKKKSDSESCARILPSSKDITSSRVGKTKSKISFLRNSYSNLTSDKYNGNGLYVKAAKKLVLDLNKQLVQYRNRKFLSRSKVINQTSSMPTGVNISLLSPHKQREYVKLQRKIIQLTRRSKEEQSEGKTKVVTSTKLTAKENKTDETKTNKAVVKSFTVRNNKIPSKEPHGNVTFNPSTESESSIPHAMNGSQLPLTDANDTMSDPGTSRISNKISKNTKDNTNDDPTMNDSVTHIQNNRSENDFSCGEPVKNIDLTGNPRSNAQESSTPAQKHERSIPAKKHQSSLCKKQESTLAKNHESVLGKRHESAPAKKHESVSARKQESAPSKKNESTSSKKYASTPSKKYESSPSKKHESALTKKQENAPAKKHETAPAKKHETAPAKKHESTMAKKHERSVSSEKRHTSTKRQCIENIQHAEHSGESIGNSASLTNGKPSEQLWSTETKLIAKRREVLENISSVRLNLHKIEAVNFKRKQLVEEMQKLKEQLKQAELHLMQKENYLNMLNIRVEEAKQNNQRCQSELLSLSLECEEIGCKVDGPNYNIPNTCADLIRNEMAAMSEAIQLLEIQKSTMNTTGTEFVQQA